MGYEMKIYFLLLVIFSLSLCQILAQNRFTSVDTDREVIVEFKANSFTKLKDHSGSLKDFQINSQSLKEKLQQNNVEEISQLIPGFTERDRIKISRTGDQVMISDWSNYYVIRIQSKNNRDNFISEIKKEGDVLSVEPNKKMKSFLIPSDEDFYKQWYLKNDGTAQQGNGTAGADIRATEAWEITTGYSDVKVAVVDYGLYSHPEYSSRLSGDATSSSSHGTLIAGIIGAEGNSDNDEGIAGIAWNVGIVNADYGNGSTASTVNAILRAINYDAYILNNSWGSGDGYTAVLRQVFADAYKLNLISIAAMGNDDLQQVDNYPAAFYQGVIAVGATNNRDEVAEFSTIGSWMDVSAPGGTDFPNDENDIYSTYIGNSYAYDHGTSFSAPVVAGISALMLSINVPGIILDNDDVENILEMTAEDKGETGFDIDYGWGRVDARNALDKLLLPYSIGHRITTGGSIHSSTGLMPYAFYGINGYTYLVKRHEVRKSVNFNSKPETRVWGRGYLTGGYSDEFPNYGLGFTDVVSYTDNSAVLKTYIYEVYSLGGGHLIGWFPCEASQVYLNYTVHQKSGVIPPGLTSMTWSNNHPKPYWVASTDPALDHYEVWKKKDGVYSLKATTTNLYYVDNSETQYSGGAGGYIYYKIRAIDSYNQSSVYSNEVQAKINDGGVAEKTVASKNDGMAVLFNLANNYPNPFNPSTEILFGLPEESSVRINVFNVLGEEVAEIVNTDFNAGTHTVSFDGKDLPGGVYIYRLTSQSKETGSFFTDTKKMVLIK